MTFLHIIQTSHYFSYWFSLLLRKESRGRRIIWEELEEKNGRIIIIIKIFILSQFIIFFLIKLDSWLDLALQGGGILWKVGVRVFMKLMFDAWFSCFIRWILLSIHDIWWCLSVKWCYVDVVCCVEAVWIVND